MKTRLMFRDRDLTALPAFLPRTEELRSDLGIEPVLTAMAANDEDLYRISERMLLGGVATPDDIRYRQAVLRDCLAHRNDVARLRAIALDAVERERRNYFGLFTRATPEKVLYRSLDVLDMFVEMFTRLRAACDDCAGRFTSEGFATFFADVATELDDAYLRDVRDHLHELRFGRGELISARLGVGNHGTDYVLRRGGPVGRRGWHRDPSGAIFDVADDDESREALAALAGRGVRSAADALAQAAEHVTRYFQTIADELGFHLAACNLTSALAERGGTWCLPEPDSGGAGFSCDGLYDPTLLLTPGGSAVGNTVDAEGCTLVMITGANRGGKSTFLRSVGIAQLMLRCGLPVAAWWYRGSVAEQVFTHFVPDEDPTAGGRLEDELTRMSAIADRIRPGALLLCNETMASTNEQEGSALARVLVDSMIEAGVTVTYVTHMFTLADGLYRRGDPHALFLRAERLGDGTRTFQLRPGEPLATSYGEDLYQQLVGEPTKTG